MHKKILILPAFSGALAVILGAFGAHALKNAISPEALDNWKTAVQYQSVHTLALLFLSMMPLNKQYKIASRCFGLGILLFSGSLYLLSLRDIINLPIYILGPITPIGGLLFIAGWFSLLFSGLNKK